MEPNPATQSLPKGLLLAFYGDDFTGSTDAMEALARAGVPTALFLEPPTPAQLAQYPNLQAFGVAGISRSLTPQEMEAELRPIFTQISAIPAPLFHVKVCSTFDSSPEVGSIGRTIDIGQAIFGSRYVPMVVGAPILGRYCLFGNLFARSGAESEVYRLDRHPTMRQHPITPMHESDLRQHLAQQTSKTIGLLDVLQLDAPSAQIRESLEKRLGEGAEVVLFDTLTEAHLATIGETLWKEATQNAPLFAVGSSGVEYALTAYWRSQGWLPEPPAFRAAPVKQIAVASGSCSPVTARQIAWALENGWAEVSLNPERLMDEVDCEAEILRAERQASVAIAQDKSVILHTCLGPEDPRLRTLSETGRALEGKRLGTALGLILRRIVEGTGIRRVAVAGGDTSGYAARALQIEALEVVTPLAPGSPLCRVRSKNPAMNGVEALFKGGQVGRINLFQSIQHGCV